MNEPNSPTVFRERVLAAASAAQKWRDRLARRLLLCAICSAVAGCSHLAERMQESAIIAARDPWTWGPLAGAAVIAATGSDRRIANWATEHTPVFGSRNSAEYASDRLREASSAGAWTTFLLADPRGEGDWLDDKAIDGGSNLAGLALARATTGQLKATVGRRRPESGGRDSFPSAHASDAFAHAGFGRYYAERLPAEPAFRTGAEWFLDAAAAGTAWARVEAGDHFPVDVLTAAAVGNFSTRFFIELSAPGRRDGWQVAPQILPDRTVVIRWRKGF